MGDEGPGLGRLGLAQVVGGPPAVPHRQGILHLLAARGALQAPALPVGARFPVPLPAVHRADEMDSMIGFRFSVFGFRGAASDVIHRESPPRARGAGSQRLLERTLNTEN